MTDNVEVNQLEITKVTDSKGNLIERGGKTSDRTLIVYGKAYRQAEVTIEDDFLFREKVTTDPTGGWGATLKKLPVGERYLEAVVNGKRSQSWILYIV
ncbi:hypothetical protein [Pseudomonas sp. RA_15y_Pfl2_54]|uniref:hypothetical protein n=1 Tax=Pseudomonas sp. RA_15y_Pfl2_54 TaxID=3088704 RepID=UPI0030D8E469